MEQDELRYAVAIITIALMTWMAGFGLYLRLRGVNANAVAERRTNGVQRALLFGALLLDLYLVLRAPFPELDAALRAAASPAPMLSVIVLLIGSLVIIASQAGMGSSWRVGVPREEHHIGALVTGGMHQFSRNPVYLGIMMFLLGALIAAPGPLTLAGVVLSYIGLTIIIRQEERYLKDRFGEEYERYAARVRRWL